MRKLTRYLLLTVAAIALPAFGARGRDQSYITFDDGGTVVKQGDDSREVDGRVNFPIYPGDEVTTNRRGRTEIRLADGNIIALDRSASVRFRSISDAYETDSTQSIVELKFGHIALQRTDNATELLRIDTPNASYAASEAAVYSVEADSHGRDRVTVYDGSIEVRTPQRSTRVNRGEEARVDDQGIYGLVNSQSGAADEFERWFMHRSERYGSPSSRYLDSSLAYSDYDLQENGSWVYVSSFGAYAWRPRVASGWRPYYYGRWGYGPGGCLTWISYEPWGWVPYHYGRWGYDAFYGWMWLPGYTYAPAWVYWAYGPGYIGWAPSGWYDCYRPYYNWAYRPYVRTGFDFGFGFYGRVRLNEVDLRPWTFVSPNGIVSNRVDQAALTTDAIRQRLIREPGAGLATVTGTPARFTRSDLKDPASAVNNIVHRGLVGGTGREGSGTAADLTSFFRRDPELSGTVRDRIVRSRVPEPSPTIAGASGGSVAGSISGVPAPGTRGTLEGRVDKDGGSARGDYRPGEATNGVFRDPYGRGSSTSAGSASDRNNNNATNGSRGTAWRDRVDRSAVPRAETPAGADQHPPATAGSDNWRGRAVERGDRTSSPSSGEQRGADRPSDIPRRIIDRIGGARITSGDTPRGVSTSSQPRNDPPRSATAPRSDPPRQQAPASRPPETHSSPPPHQEQHSSPPPKSNDGGGGGGRVKRGD